ncbi:hypothetical protein GOV12_05445 [Candidatus Pacearchaeota archaeon]|nr:hypothetical protein [Candidatus Pacearchaeota archaeon]
MASDLGTEVEAASRLLEDAKKKLNLVLPKLSVDMVEISRDRSYRVRVSQVNGREEKVLYESDALDVKETSDFEDEIRRYLTEKGYEFTSGCCRMLKPGDSD